MSVYLGEALTDVLKAHMSADTHGNSERPHCSRESDSDSDSDEAVVSPPVDQHGISRMPHPSQQGGGRAPQVVMGHSPRHPTAKPVIATASAAVPSTSCESAESTQSRQVPKAQYIERILETRVPHLPLVKKDPSDRNRTSPVAFTVNKFEV